MPKRRKEDFFGFKPITKPQHVINREILFAKRMEIVGPFVVAQSNDGTIYLSEHQLGEET